MAVEQRIRVRGHEPGAHQRQGERQIAHRACATGDANAAAITVTSTIPAVYLVAIATPSASPASTYSRVRPVAVDAGHADQAQRQRRQVGASFKREMAVVHGQERDRQQRTGHDTDATVLEQPRAGDRGQRDGERAEERGRPAGPRERRRRIGRERASHRRRIGPPAHREHRVDEYVNAGGMMK